LGLIPGANIIAAGWVCRATLLPSYYQIFLTSFGTIRASHFTIICSLSLTITRRAYVKRWIGLTWCFFCAQILHASTFSASPYTRARETILRVRSRDAIKLLVRVQGRNNVTPPRNNITIAKNPRKSRACACMYDGYAWATPPVPVTCIRLRHEIWK